MSNVAPVPPSDATHASASPARRRERYWCLAFLLALPLILAILTWSRWGWRVAALSESPLSGPWRLPNSPVKVLTWNIQFGRRLDEALEVIRAESPDILCLQEIRPEQMARIERSLNMEGHWSPSSNLIGDAAWGNAVFVAGELDQVQSLRDSQGRAFGVWAAAELKGGRFIVGSVHLMHAKRKDGGIAVRQRETQALLDAYAALNSQDGLSAPAIIAGDFNEPPLGSVHRLISTRFDDASATSGATLPAKLPLLRVDYIFSSREFEAASNSVPATNISDHRPVMAVLSPAHAKRNSYVKP